MNMKKPLLPKLRFPEFRGKGEWEKKRLGDCLDYLQPTAYLVSDTNYNDSYKIPVLTAGKTFILGYTNEKHGIFCEGLPVIIFDDFTTATQFVDFPFKAKSSAMKILKSKNGTNVKFMHEILQMISYKIGVHERHWISRFSTMQVFIPCLAEQQKIAKCLSSLDEIIVAETQKLGSYKTHKEGLMQGLFPAEGKRVPRLCFPEFKGKGEWQKRKISNLLTRSVSSVSVELEESYQEIGIRSHGKGIFHKEFVKGKTLGNKRVFWVEDNAFVLNIVFAWEQAVAVTSTVEKGMIASHRFPMYIAKKNKSVVNFIKYFFLTKKGKELLGIASPGGAGRNKTLGQKEFENLDFFSPSMVAEQQKIADCLSSLDELISAQTEKLEILKTQKKGLTQQLFPTFKDTTI